MADDEHSSAPGERLAFMDNGYSAEYKAIIGVAFQLVYTAQDLREIAYRIDHLSGEARLAAVELALSRIAALVEIARDAGLPVSGG